MSKEKEVPGMADYAQSELGATPAGPGPSPENLEFDHCRTFGEVMGDGKIHFHDELDKVEIEALIGMEFIMKQVTWQPWEGEGNNGFYLVWCRDRDGKEFTTKMGGKALINRIRAFIAKRAIPIRVKLTVKESSQGFGNYYDFE